MELYRNRRGSFSCKFSEIWWALGALNAPAKEVNVPIFPEKMKKIMNSDQTTRHLILFLFYVKRRCFGLN